MPGRDIIVIGSSAGAVEPLARLVADLSPCLRAGPFVAHCIPGSGFSASDLRRAERA
jgi:hypothetical protein